MLLQLCKLLLGGLQPVIVQPLYAVHGFGQNLGFVEHTGTLVQHVLPLWEVKVQRQVPPLWEVKEKEEPPLRAGVSYQHIPEG